MDAPTDTPQLPFSEAAERNRQPILEVLLRLLPARGHVLEVGSGTGQHVVYFAPRFERLSWQPTEQREFLAGLNARIRSEGCAGVLPAIELDVRRAWPDREFAAAYSANTAHIMSWPEVELMFAGIGARLAPGGVFCLYGPFNQDGYTAESNAEFDRHLRQRDEHMGLREIADLERLAGAHGMRLDQRIAMPANNQLLVFRRTQESRRDG